MIKILKSQFCGKGTSGLYFRISQREGVKIFFRKKHKRPGNILKSLPSESCQEIIREATIGKLAHVSKRLSIVEFEGFYYLGIVQKHISGRMGNTTPKEVLAIKKGLKAAKIIHGDIHNKNVIRTKNKLVPIDFDSRLSWYFGDKKTYYTVKNGIIKELKHTFRF